MALLAAFAGYVLLAPIPSPASQVAPAGTVVLDSRGVVLQRDTAEGLRIPVALSAVAPIMREATVAAEDQRFWGHLGVDAIAMARAAFSWRKNPSGASTITQQLARRAYLHGGGGPAPVRKVRESVLALRIEAHTTKSEVLEAYLNTVYYGRGAYGVEAAARVYFGASAANLDLARAAYLAGLPQSPGLFEGADEAVAKERQRYVLDRLADDGRISRAEADAAAAAPLAFEPALAPPLAPHFVAYALDELARVRPDLAGQRGLVIETTLDASLQATAERSARARLEQLKDREAGNAAVVVTEPRSGRVLVMVGSADFADPAGGQLNMALQPRQPGSALKPFLYALALERGATAATQLLDVPTTFQAPTGPYSPLNYDRRFHGPVTLRTALASSYNVPAVRVLSELGLDAFLDMAHRAGLATLTDSERYGLALTLGGGEVRLIDMAEAYGMLANLGERVEPYAIERVRDASGRVVYQRPGPAPARVMAPAHAWLIGDILRDPEARLPGFGAGGPLELGFPAAVKTGTTTGSRDNWTAGYTPDRVTVVWVGNTDNRPMRDVSGVDGAAPTWHDVMEAAHAGREPAAPPPPPGGLVRATVCVPTGLLPGPDCPSTAEEWFMAGTVPRERERYYVRAGDGQLRLAVPPEARPWALDAGVSLAAGEETPEPDLRVLAPRDGAVLYLAPELGANEVLLRAAAAGAGALELRVDGALAASGAGPELSVRWPLQPGRHAIELIATGPDGARRSATSHYEVKPR